MITGKIIRIDDITNWLNNIVDDVTPKKLTSWTSKIQNKANEYYKNSHNYPIKFEMTYETNSVIKWNYDDNDAKLCIICAIKYQQNFVTLGVQALSDSIIKILEKENNN